MSSAYQNKKNNDSVYLLIKSDHVNFSIMKTPVYFISDVHLKLEKSNDETKRRNKLYRLFDKIVDTGGTCFFVGDLFDFYFEYPDLIPKAYRLFY